VSGHHIYTRDGVLEILNLQPRGSQAKAYQVKQVRGVIVDHGLAGEPELDRTDEDARAAESDLSNRKEDRMANRIQYEIILYWSKEDQAFIAEVPELPGCAADGATYQDAIVNAELVIQEWIETAQELGRPVPEPRGRLIYA
jgi:predicted RNase H-like HicB family nuclease